MMDNSNLNTPGCSFNRDDNGEKLDKNLPGNAEEASVTSHGVNASSTTSGLTPQINTSSIDERDNSTLSGAFPNSSGPSTATGTPIHTTPVISDIETPIITNPALSSEYHRSTGLGTLDERPLESPGHNGVRGRMHDLSHRMQSGVSHLKEKAFVLKDELRERASGFKDELTHKASSSGEMLKDKAGMMTDRVKHADYRGMTHRAMQPVRSYPERSIMIAAGLGFVLGILAGRGHSHSSANYDKRVFPYKSWNDDDTGCC